MPSFHCPLVHSWLQCMEFLLTLAAIFFLAGEMAQPVKCLPYKPKGLSSIPVTSIKKLNMIECVCNPNAGVGVVTYPWN